MPWTEGGRPVAMERLLGLVKLGITEWASRTVPAALMRTRLGMRPAAMAASR